MSERKSAILANGLFYTVALILAYGLKSYYSRAGSDDLVWILAPVAHLIQGLTGISFGYEAHCGYINETYDILIAPACAGINFLIIAFSMTVFSSTHHLSTVRQKLLWLVVCAVCAYGLTIGVNALRIIISIHMYRADIYNEWLTPERCHRVEGVFIYFFFQCVFYFIMRAVARRYSRITQLLDPSNRNDVVTPTATIPIICSGLVPLGWYLGITVVVPMFNDTPIHNVPLFVEHCLFVGMTSLTVLTFILFVRMSWHKRRDT